MEENRRLARKTQIHFDKVFLTPLNPLEWLASNFSLQDYPWITQPGHENKGNDHQLKKLLIVKQILLVSTLRNV